MKVFLLSSGFHEYMVELANSLSQQATVVLALPENRINSKLKALISNKVIYEPFHWVDYTSIRDNYKMLRSIKTILDKHNPQVIHIQAHGFKNFYLLLPFLNRKKLINTIHDPVPHTGDQVSKGSWLNHYMVNRYTDKVIVHGDYLKQEAIDKVGFEENKVVSIPHGDLGLYQHWRIKDYPKEKNTFLFFGRIWPYKGLKYFIEAANRLARKRNDVKFIIAGKGENFEFYEDLIEDKTRFEIRNYRIPEEEVDELFQKAYCTVLPYTDATQSGVIPIAYMYKVLVLASAVGSLPEVVEDFKTGVLVPPKDVVALFDNMEWIIENPDKCNKMVAEAGNFALTQLNWDVIAKQTLSVYKSKPN